MATILSPSAIFSSSSPTPPRTQTNSPPSKSQIALLPPTTTSINNNINSNSNKSSLASAAAAAAAAVILSTTPTPPPSLADPSTSFSIYYGTAASAANYGGYGGNSSKKDSAEYVYDVPDGWKERPVSKVEKGTNGTDSGFYNPKKKSEKEYLTFLAGFRQLAPMDVVLNNLALSDVELQDLISSADSVNSQEKKDENGQVYYVYEIDGAGAHSLISVTCANNKLYAHFVNAPNPEWNKDQDTLKHLHESFKTVGSF
ncbi:thylakoid lumenal protein, chloroplastic [Cinnamomum micranthum f. kanehirae]|uniref:Thylakoid lumenal protein, chloroplastic n=1 Tax=Cinnamomum micranthum f. kanehirae TaxID=337451 RepID=A0A443NBY3_9MAGN|nr:thylakoid lumenal protein, chloroplastic [Cinnamomum micranthum f. kanehirae]